MKSKKPTSRAIADKSKKKELEDIPNSNDIHCIGFVIVMIASTILMIYLFWPLLTPFLFAAIFASATYRLVNYFQNRFQIKRPLVVSGILFLLFLLLFLPTLYVTIRLSEEITKLYVNWKSVIDAEFIQTIVFGDNLFAKSMRDIFGIFNIPYTMEKFEEIISKFVLSFSASSLKVINIVLNNSLEFLFQFFLMLIFLFAILWKGHELKIFLTSLSPLKRSEEDSILEQFNRMNHATLVHNGIAALLQGGLSGIGLLVCGIKSAFLWTVIMIIFALLPFVGTGLVFLPAAGYLFFIGHHVSAIALIIWCVLASLFIENWYKPTFMGRDIQVDSFLVFFSIIGGMSTFGVSGIFFGPIILVVFLTVSNIYLKNYAHQKVDKKES